jgi:hypothetical protein
VSARTVTIALWVAIVVVAGGLEVAARRGQRLPTLGAIGTAVTRRRTGRLLLFAVWAWSGWHFFVR